ncbi:23S rRNA (pseudouridine(1915)-N(3))-methyltransferase RlmH [Paraperlucidibaca wandonensis]|jgi:23S rRNA (pseudouridine1915-N3)-methyltransferase|uniref:Ribosomal RNA large subunit methyltransferase H n=1 Tax=Paraperlucidibaca wandonensis TaxID=1268273 RepID=A0ABW3HGB7_9GAMM|nr:23S rRNA (pseudouridine(1915)-N(3))-methyltransferase RlmH [Paraperlucidibaca sp.]MBQ0722372.1 23S rRNA (pseudouridine(1915)-N(3))-methyltransferase RlmH [Paraperlucidibaca sp.]MBQ0841947.1 23S rRNA (pseudouridine(1915)-N(3))-methyltransferase RlmH [Paraperlucidibaca sp.]|tara:strand:+ start:4109 stop:4576 length:468 start_codon:yes stop_codon:yes gene_type:complete
MKIRLIAVGTRMPDWVSTGYHEFSKRLNDDVRLELVEIAAGKRGKSVDIARLTEKEGEAQLAAVANNDRVIALEVHGKPWSTEDLSQKLRQWLAEGRNISLLVGGPEGLSADASARADEQWSLSPLTLPHPLVRVLLAEQIYRAWTLLKGHPYHR